MAAALESATSRPRRLWGAAAADVQVGNRADLLILDASPFDDENALRSVRLLGG